MKSFRLTFLAPNPTAFQSGGNIYNLRLMEALRKLGADVQRAEPDKLQKENGLLIVDTLYMEDFDPSSWPGQALLLVHHLTSLYPPDGWESESFFREKEAPFLRHYDGFLTTSAFTTRYLQMRGIEKPLITAPPALEFQPAAMPRTYPPVRGLIIANLVERKGILPMLEALKRYAHWNQLQLQLYGSSRLEPGYAARCLRLLETLQGVATYCGERPQQAVYQAYQKSNLLISPSYMETYGMVLQEAAARGLPILAYRGGNAEAHVRRGATGFLCDTHQEMAKRLQQWENQPAELRQLAKQARQMAQQHYYTWEDSARRLLEALASLRMIG